MAPQNANLFMAQLEENYLASCNTRPLTYLQYIDDILIIWTVSEKELLAFHQRFNQFHPPSTLPLTTLTHTSNSWIQPSTSKMESYKHPYTKNQQAVLHILYTRLKQIFPELPLLSYRQPLNLREMIVRSALPKTTKAGTFPCNSNRFETCKYILCKDQVAIPNTQKIYTILDHYSCASSNVVYMITCTKHKINSKSCDTPVLILKGNFKTERERKIYEFKCMELFNTLRQGLNLGSGFMSHYMT
ncbi:hypothetical protein XELAEV_18010973mg [Xenopus laevis]|uniref:Reverse transcriptase domain-containing protein n=1 Tax=Xenopus laevis TaxID=8355 RepID=A0A974DWV8_XENLA|nr:hypothetical protein XELAEV_18010973mg [Xenopus laevis]